MSVRRLLVTTSVAFALLAPVAHAAPGFRLDGRRTTSKKWTATVVQPATPTTSVVLASPSLDECAEDTCDVRALTLSLPRGTSWGRFTARVTVPLEVQTSIALYDAKGTVVEYADFMLGGWQTSPEDGTYDLSISIPRLRRGTYTFATHGRIGSGQVSATVGWIAMPPDRGSNTHLGG